MTKDEEEVRKRRGKTSSSRFNAHQKAILVAGILSLFLTVGLSPGMAPILFAGIVGGTLLLVLFLKNLKPQKEEAKKVDPVEPIPPLEEKAVGHPESAIGPEEKEIFISQETVPSEIIQLRQGLPDDEAGEQLKKVEEETPEEKEFLRDPQVLPENGRWAEIRERVVLLEEKTINLEDMLMQLEEKVANIQENYLKSEPKIDLQTILTNIEERAEKIA